MSKLSEFLKAKRAEKSLSQMDVAKSLGYTTSQFISNWERGVSYPPPNTIKQLGKSFGVNADQLLELILEDVSDKARESVKARFAECEG